MMARTSVGSVLGLGARGVRGARSEGGTFGVLDLEFEAPAVDDDLEAAGAVGQDAGGRAAAFAAGTVAAEIGARVRRRRAFHLADDLARQAVADEGSLHRGHRSTTSAGPPAQPGRVGRRYRVPTVRPGRRAAGWPCRRPSRAASPAGPDRTLDGERRRWSGPSQWSPTQSVDRSPARNAGVPGHPAMERQGGLDPGDLDLVERPGQAIEGGDPVRRRWTMTLAIRLSYSGGMRSPSTRPVSTRTPGPAGIRQRRTVPGVGAKSRDGSSAVRRTSIAWLVGRRGAARRRRAPPADSGSPAARRNCSWTMSRPVDQLGDPVLHLEAGVDLEEVERAVRRPQELAGRGVAQPGGRRDPDRLVVQVAPLGRGQARRRRLLDQLLVAALERAVALAEGDDTAGRVAQELDLDVAGRPDLALQVDGPVAEGRQGLGRRGGQGRRQLASVGRPGACRVPHLRPRP